MLNTLEQSNKLLQTRVKDLEQRAQSQIKDNSESLGRRVDDLKQKWTETAGKAGTLESKQERTDLLFSEKFLNLERGVDAKCNALERTTEKKVQLSEFDVKANVSTQLLDFEERVNKNLSQVERNNRTFRKLITHELVEKTRNLFTVGLTELENKVILKLENNRERIATVEVDLKQLIRDKMLDLFDKIFRVQEEFEGRMGMLEDAINGEIERVDKEATDRAEKIQEVCEELRGLIETEGKRFVGLVETMTAELKDEFAANLGYEKSLILAKLAEAMEMERADRTKSESERLIGIQNRWGRLRLFWNWNDSFDKKKMSFFL